LSLQYPEVREATGSNWVNRGTTEDLYLFFEDLHASMAAVPRLVDHSRTFLGPLMTFQYVSSDEYCHFDRQGAALRYDSEYAGQSLITAIVKPCSSGATAASMTSAIIALARRYGNIHTYVACGFQDRIEHNIRLEFVNLVSYERFLNVFVDGPFETNVRLLVTKSFLRFSLTDRRISLSLQSLISPMTTAFVLTAARLCLEA